MLEQTCITESLSKFWADQQWHADLLPTSFRHLYICTETHAHLPKHIRICVYGSVHVCIHINMYIYIYM